MGKRKPMPSAAARGSKNQPKRPKSTKQGAELPEENPQLSEHDDAEILDTESGAAGTVQLDKKANGSFQGTAQSDEDDMEDEYDAPSGDAPGDTINNGNDCFDETETSCSFHRHVSHIMTNEEVKALMKKNYKFKWEMPAVDIPRSKWVGTGENVQEACDDHLRDVKGKLRDHWQRTLSDHLNSRMSFFSLCNSYRDIMHCNKKPFYLKSNGPDSSTMDAYLMHALNHVHRTRDVVIRNDAKLRNDTDRDISDDKTYLDQGFTRPKVLFLLPLKSFARRIVKRLIQLSPLPQKDSAMGQFKKEFGESDDEGIPEHSTKPADFDLLFAGDIDDHFLFGVKLTKKSIKLYSNFYSSDIIVASPLALKRKIDGGEHGKEKDFDFLSSIEIVVVDHADVISMQNWEHLEAVFEQLNQLPTNEHGTNVMRIRPWYLDQHAQYYRQTILLSSYLTPEINALFNGLCLNYEGKIKMVTEYAGVLPKIQLEVRQVYERFDASSIAEADDARFDYFCNKVYPKIQDLDEGGLLLFVSSYFEYIRISNFIKSKEASFCRIGEATSQQDISRSRLWFFEGKKKILLYSERSHFYHRYKIRGTKHLLIYSLPGRNEFYPELVNMLDESENRKCNVLFSRLDLLKLERIVGTSSTRRLISSDKGMFVFC
ncbi:protein NUCLEOLAR FACTOR 1-like isoform X1 [Miscanthus floridulus]|uniref:protein NUCLEOLAR FACTOR 1-like isoform X1 n=2 Tax=Miscanthus floridulus TaxID=154761 RepID=UPI0034595451